MMKMDGSGVCSVVVFTAEPEASSASPLLFRLLVPSATLAAPNNNPRSPDGLETQLE